MRRSEPGSPRGARRLLVDSLQLLGLSALVFAQPLLDLLGRQPEFFVIRGSRPVDLWLLVAGLVLLAPAPLLLLRWAARFLGSRWAVGLQSALVGALVGTLVLQGLNHRESGEPWWPLAVLTALTVPFVYLVVPAARLFVSVLSIAVLLVPAGFLLRSEVRPLLAGPSAEGPALAASGAETPIFILVFDELGLPPLLDADGEIDAGRFPNLASLASVATWYADAATVSDNTQTAVPALLSGRFPDPGRLPSLEDHPENLFTLFGGDYAIYAEESLTRLCPPEINRLGVEEPGLGERLEALVADLGVIWLHLTLPPRLAGGLPPIDHDWGGFLATARTAEQAVTGPEGSPQTRREFHLAAVGALYGREARLPTLLGAIGPDLRALYFFHLPYPHFPWEHFPSGRRYLRPRDPAIPISREWPESPEMAAQAYIRYQLQLMYADRLVGRFLDRLREVGLFDPAVVVVTADHGSSFRPGSLRRVYSPETLGELVAVPLLIKAPHQEDGEVVTAPVSLVDVVPTILDLVGVPTPEGLDGSPAGAVHGGRARYFLTRDGSRFPLPSLTPLVREATEELAALVGGLFGEEELLARGPFPELRGARLRDLELRERGDLDLTIDGPERFRSVDLALSALPLMVTGTLAPADGAGCCGVAVAVDGVVRATTTTLADARGRHRWAALLPEAAIAAGDNRVEAFLIRPGTQAPILQRPTARRPRAFELAFDDGEGVTTVVADGVRLAAGSELRGFLERVDLEGDELRILGWAVDLESEGAAEDVLFFFRDRLVGRGVPALPQRGLARVFGDAAFQESRFETRLPARLFPDLEAEGLRAFALSSRGSATELGYYYRHIEELPGGGEALRAGNGRLLRVEPRALRHWVGGIRREGDELVVVGWAADPVAREPAFRIVAMVGGRHHTQVGTGRPRPRLEELLGVAGVERSGFRLPLSRAAEDALARGDLRLFAVSGSRPVASELRLPALAPPEEGADAPE